MDYILNEAIDFVDTEGQTQKHFVPNDKVGISKVCSHLNFSQDMAAVGLLGWNWSLKVEWAFLFLRKSEQPLLTLQLLRFFCQVGAENLVLLSSRAFGLFYMKHLKRADEEAEK